MPYRYPTGSLDKQMPPVASHILFETRRIFYVVNPVCVFSTSPEFIYKRFKMNRGPERCKTTTTTTTTTTNKESGTRRKSSRPPHWRKITRKIPGKALLFKCD